MNFDEQKSRESPYLEKYILTSPGFPNNQIENTGPLPELVQIEGSQDMILIDPDVTLPEGMTIEHFVSAINAAKEYLHQSPPLVLEIKNKIVVNGKNISGSATTNSTGHRFIR